MPGVVFHPLYIYTLNKPNRSSDLHFCPDFCPSQGTEAPWRTTPDVKVRACGLMWDGLDDVTQREHDNPPER